MSELFEDPNFVPGPAILPDEFKHKKIEWKRPHDLSKDPQFITEKSHLEQCIFQGADGDCWFLAALGSLCVGRHYDAFKQVVPVTQTFQKGYNGEFKFNFWKSRAWQEVIIDDRLPTEDGKLIFADKHHCHHGEDFWVPLVEKAYAKFKGGYNVIGEGGNPCTALKDFTGDRTETVDLHGNRHNTWSFMTAPKERSSLMAALISEKKASRDDQGLHTDHAYSILNLQEVSLTDGGSEKLIELRNPWGDHGWTGKWCNRNAPEWNQVDESTKSPLLSNMDNGEFWMSFGDFIEHFDYLLLCYLD